jgi:hypothetical protein
MIFSTYLRQLTKESIWPYKYAKALWNNAYSGRIFEPQKCHRGIECYVTAC